MGHGRHITGSTYPVPVPPPPVPVLKDFYNTGEDDDYFCYGEGGDAQIITPLTSYTLTSIKLKLRANNNFPNPGTVKIGIQSTGIDGGPSGTYLTSIQFNTSDLPVFPAAAEWREITFTTPINVIAGTKYAIVFDMFDNPPNTCILIRDRHNTGAYAGGETWGGSPGWPWSKLNQGKDDLMFECWGY